MLKRQVACAHKLILATEKMSLNNGYARQICELFAFEATNQSSSSSSSSAKKVGPSGRTLISKQFLVRELDQLFDDDALIRLGNDVPHV